MSNLISGMVRRRLIASTRLRGGGGHEIAGGHHEAPPPPPPPKAYPLNRTPPPPRESRKWEDWELPCYVTSFLTIVILGVGLNAKPDLTLETWAHHKALERLRQQEAAAAAESD